VNLPHRTVPDPASTLNFEAIGAQLPVYAERLPDTPRDGQEIYYAADAANGVIWHLRYRSGASGSYKWEYLGGPSLYGANMGQSSRTLASWDTPTGGGFTRSVPLAGVYDLTYEFRGYHTIANNACEVGFSGAGLTAGVNFVASTLDAGNSFTAQGNSVTRRLTLSVGTLSEVMKNSTGSGAAYIDTRQLFITPIRVG
jgi:hypothetical protein